MSILQTALRNSCRAKGLFNFANSQIVKAGRLSSLAPKRLNLKIQVSPGIIARTSSTGNHSAIWTAERGLSVGLLVITPAAIAFPSQALDAMLAVSVVMHQYWGLEAIVTDYVRPILFGNVVPKVAHGALLLISIATLGGLFYFIYNDIGIGKSVRKLWSVKGQ